LGKERREVIDATAIQLRLLMAHAPKLATFILSVFYEL